MAIPPVPAPTVASIEAAKLAAAIERADIYFATGVFIDEDGNIQLYRSRDEERSEGVDRAVDGRANTD